MTAFGLLLLLFGAACGAGVVTAVVAGARHAASAIGWLGGIAGVILVVGGTTVLWDPVATTIPLWTIPAIGQLVLRGDPLAGVFLLVSGLVILPVSVFTANGAPRRLAAVDGRVYAALYFVLLLAIAWVLVAGDLFSLLVAWEIMSILCYLLVASGSEDRETRYAAYLLLAIGEIGALAATAGLLLLAVHAGALDFLAMRNAGPTLEGGPRLAVFLLTFFGFGVKAGLVPVNAWLPRAYTAAPAPFVPLLAGATLNLGLYGIVRTNADLLPPASAAPGIIALVTGSLTALLGILYATTEIDLKGVLAHSSIENAGIVTAGLGAGFVFVAAHRPTLAAVAFLVALYHMTNHSMYKTLLFLASGTVAERTGTRNLDRLGGLIRGMPRTALVVLVGVLAIAGLPPLNGFVSEWLTLETLLRSAELRSLGEKVAFALCGAGLALTAALAVTCFVKYFAMGFLGTSRSPEATQATDPGAITLVPMALLAVICVLLGVLPTYVIGALDRAVRPIAHGSAVGALVPPFFAGSAGHNALPASFAGEFHDIGAQVGERLVPGRGLVILHRGGSSNPVVFAGAPTYLLLVTAGLLALVAGIVHVTVARQRTVLRRAVWDGGLRRLLPEMTYTATGFSNPVRVVFQAIFRPTVVEDTQQTVAEHFRSAIVRHVVAVHVVDRLVLQPARTAALGVAHFLARMHHGRLNAYVMYALGALLVTFAVGVLA